MADTRTETPADDTCSRCGSTFEHLHLFEGRPGQFCRDCAVALLAPKKAETPADEMREAAARAREHLLPAVTARVIEHTAVVVICGDHDEPAEICRNCHYFDVQDRVLARLVVTLINARDLLASWLETEARMWEKRGNSADGHTFHALAVARTLNGGPS
ncbi:hypothetical protein ACIBQX_11600 [Nonomuraea sp. NPDC049714]|uniref:hypothetical protein n=1 Tax=Nonomuraea sp. NPDC049714 TaxID=3364357 RepID=UPI00379496B8